MSYNFPAGPITMAEVVRYANEYGMYFAGSKFPRMSSIRRASGVSSYSAPILTCEASLSGLSDVEEWRDAGKTLEFIAVMNVSGAIYAAANDAKPANVLLDISWAGGWGGFWNNKVGSANSYTAAQNDPTDNLRRNLHAMYVVSACGSRLATSTDQIVGTVSVDMTNLDVVYSFLEVELSILDIVSDTAGLA